MSPSARLPSSWLRIALSLALSGGMLYFSFRKAPVAQVVQALQQVHGSTFFLAGGMFTLAFLARARAWQVLLEERVSYSAALASLMAGFLVSNVLPLRLGEGARIVALHQATGLRWSPIVISVALDRLTDALFLAWLVLALAPLALPGVLPPAVWLLALSALPLLAGFYLAAGRLLERLETWAARLHTRPGGARLGKWLPTLFQSLRPMTRPDLALRFLLWKALTWLPVFVSQDILLRSWFPHAAWWWSPWIVAVTTLATILPAAPGHVGTMEAGTLAALARLTSDRAAGLALALTQHVLYYLVSTGLGLLGLAWLGLPLRRLYALAQNTHVRPFSEPLGQKEPPSQPIMGDEGV